MKKTHISVMFIALFACACGSAPDKRMVSKTGEMEKEWVEEGITRNYIFAPA